MFSGLYGDLPEAKDEQKKAQDGTTWTGTTTLKPTSVANRRQVSFVPTTLRATPTPGGGRGGRGEGLLGRGTGRGGERPKEFHHTLEVESSSVLHTNQETHLNSTAHGASGTAAQITTLSFGSDIRDEYDPAHPNDYLEFRKRKEQQRLEAEAEAQRQEHLRELKHLEELERQRHEKEAEEAEQRQQERTTVLDEEQRRAALHLSGEEAYLRRGQPLTTPSSYNTDSANHQQRQSFDADAAMSFGTSSGGGLGLGGHLPSSIGQPKGMGLAQKMLEKMGWKEGQGLGRNQQGIAAPLVMQKTDARSGIIVAAEPPPQAGPAKAGLGPPSRVIMLRNVVGRGQVDDSLDEEVGQECSKFGEVLNVLMFEVTEPDFPDDEAVRIFVEFEMQQSADKALMDLNGRFFGGRVVKGCYFDQKRFESNDLAPRPDEIREIRR